MANDRLVRAVGQRLRTLRLRTLIMLGLGLLSILPARAQNYDYFNVRGNSDYYRYRYHESYARPEQFLRTVEYGHLGLGQQKLHTGNYEGAFHEFDYVLRGFPNHPQGLLGMEEVCRKRKSPRCMMDEYFAKAVAVNPNAAGTYVAQGIYFARSGRYPAAIDSYKRALELQPDSGNTHYNLGLAYLETEQYELANQHAQTAYRLGFQLRALRDKLQRVGHWKPSASGEPIAARPAPETGESAATPLTERDASAPSGARKGQTK